MLVCLSPHIQELGGDVVLVAHKCLDYDAKVSIVYVRILSCVYGPSKNRCFYGTWRSSAFHTVPSSGNTPGVPCNTFGERR